MEKEKKWMDALYPRNLLYAVRGYHEEKEPTELTPDILSGIQYVLSTLSEREQFVLKSRFADRKYLRSIGEALGVSTRTKNALARAGYSAIGDLVGLYRREISHIKNLGPKQRQEVAAGLRHYGVTETDWDFFRPRDKKQQLEV